ncbi:MAG: hypothetical protein J5554_08400 [Paludibacteraceae bacterium]|nr:hypothetical protein [Paludibacteraceae bacterium]
MTKTTKEKDTVTNEKKIELVNKNFYIYFTISTLISSSIFAFTLIKIIPSFWHRYESDLTIFIASVLFVIFFLNFLFVIEVPQWFYLLIKYKGCYLTIADQEIHYYSKDGEEKVFSKSDIQKVEKYYSELIYFSFLGSLCKLSIKNSSDLYVYAPYDLQYEMMEYLIGPNTEVVEKKKIYPFFCK